LSKSEENERHLSEELQERISHNKVLLSRNELLSEELEQTAKNSDKRLEVARKEKEQFLIMIQNLKEELYSKIYVFVFLKYSFFHFVVKQNTLQDFQADSVNKAQNSNRIICSLETRIDELIRKIEELNSEASGKNKEVKRFSFDLFKYLFQFY